MSGSEMGRRIAKELKSIVSCCGHAASRRSLVVVQGLSTGEEVRNGEVVLREDNADILWTGGRFFSFSSFAISLLAGHQLGVQSRLGVHTSRSRRFPVSLEHSPSGFPFIFAPLFDGPSPVSFPFSVRNCRPFNRYTKDRPFPLLSTFPTYPDLTPPKFPQTPPQSN